MLMWLSVWSEVQLMPLPSCLIKIQIDVTFLVPVYLGCAGKEAIKLVFVCLFESSCKMTVVDVTGVLCANVQDP